MDTLVRQGKVLYWGTSEWPAEQIREAHEAARAGGCQAPTMEQPQYNLLQRERAEAEYEPLYADFGMGTTTWSPLRSEERRVGKGCDSTSSSRWYADH